MWQGLDLLYKMRLKGPKFAFMIHPFAMAVMVPLLPITLLWVISVICSK